MPQCFLVYRQNQIGKMTITLNYKPFDKVYYSIKKTLSECLVYKLSYFF